MIYQLIGRDPELMEIIKLDNKNLKISIITSQVVLVVKNPPASAGDMGLIPGLGRSPKGGNGNPLQYSCLGNSRTEEPGGLQSMGSQRVRHGLAHGHTHEQTTFVYPVIY